MPETIPCYPLHVIYILLRLVCLLTTEENKEIRDKQPRNYLQNVRSDFSYFKKKMDRHLIPYDEQSGIWSKDVKRGFTKFMKQRAEMIRQAAEDAAAIPLFRRDK